MLQTGFGPACRAAQDRHVQHPGIPIDQSGTVSATGLLIPGQEIGPDCHHFYVRVLWKSRPAAAARADFAKLMGDTLGQARGCSRVIISCEGLCKSHHWLHGHHLSLFRETFRRVRLLLYVRRQDEYISSAQNQVVKSHGHCQPLSIEKLLENVQDVPEEIERMIRDFRLSSDDVLVRPYEKEQFVGGDLVSDFLAVLDLPGLEHWSIPARRENTGLSRKTLEYKRLINAVSPAELHISQRRQWENRFVDPLLEFDRLYATAEDCMSLLSPSDRIDILRQCEPGNRRLAREWMGRSDGVLFTRPLPKEAERWVPFDGALAPEAVVQITEFIASGWPELATDLRAAVGDAAVDAPFVEQARQVLSPGLVLAERGS